ncbi:MAG TPA: 4-alpha-glucanotransferase [Caulifigura sp.]|nr:4-alpha-glucanotransferase [Caulifigura sp.]
MTRRRRAGVLLHVSSLPGKFGIGDLGPEAFAFLDQLAKAKQSVWQILPLGPTGYGDSPYQCYSAFAGNPLFISPENLIADGLLPDAVARESRKFAAGTIDFEKVTPARMGWLRQAFDAFQSKKPKKLVAGFEEFREAEKRWLDEFALFMALRDQWPDRSWVDWPEKLRSRDKRQLAEAKKEFADGILFHQWVQFEFARQWNDLHAYARGKEIEIMGDAPIFVSHESSDVWANQEQFDLRVDGRPRMIAGVPPDYFSKTGQRWGNPQYRWDRMEADGFKWWIQRMEASLKFVDLIRLDHFRGFEAFWEIPSEAPTAATGKWVPGPREKLFKAMQKALGDLPIIAEDLGVITAEVRKLRDDFGFPGMRVLQFGFGGDDEIHRTHFYVQNCVAYTGTHDNDTTVGWFNAEPGKTTTMSLKAVQAERKMVLDYLNTTAEEIHWGLIRGVHGSVADLAMVPVQDVLGLGSEARMNTPGTSSGNWRWRLKPGQLNTAALRQLAHVTQLYDRSPDSPPPTGR